MAVDSAGTRTDPLPNNTNKMEPKVKWGAIGAYLLGLVLLVLINAFTGDDNALLIEALPDYLEPFLLPLVPALASLAAGFSARHQYRNAEVPQRPGAQLD